MTTELHPRAYPLDNDHDAAAAHHRVLAELLDRHSRARIRGLLNPAGARCLELGAGGGSMTAWLAEQVGDGGQVTACDVKPDHVAAHPRVTVVGHDVAGGSPWPPELDGPYDLIFTRLTLAHLPARHEITTALVRRLTQGGALLIEDWAAHRSDMVVNAPSAAAAELYERYQRHVSDIFAAAGTDHTWAPGIHPLLRRHGLARVETVIHARYWTAANPGLRLVTGVAVQLRTQLNQRGFTDRDLDMLGGLLDDPRLVIRGHPLYSTSGFAEG